MTVRHPSKGGLASMGHQINLKQVRCFVVVAEELNFRRAAERLFMSQPPLSRHIKALEASLGITLFDRDRQGVQLTDAGEAFMLKAKALLQQSDNLVSDMGTSDLSATRSLRVGITTSVNPDFFADITPLFERDFPEHRIDIKRQISLRSIKDVGRGALDVALIGMPSQTEGLPFKPLQDDPLVAAIPATHRLAKKRNISLIELQEDRLFWFSRKLNPSYYDHCEQGFNRFNFHPERLPEPEEHHVLLGLIAAGQGIALMPSSLRAIQHRNVVHKELREAAFFKIGIAIIWQNEQPPSHVSAFIDMLAAHCAAPASP